ncbi:BLUF domain-containing protein [Oceaniglobus ichthyenteri]|uniref:BLUF domain-containing protein n=1 Tax=Oceaniglobus ichthyenteri TaxID=2136177 RepID=UPI0013DDDD67|nr:BLUF domain-containing protein [Oceaniglobus ichthyenteri]
MIRLLYVSESTGDNLHDILSVARRNNPELGMTGILITHGTTFIQLLEGPKETMPELIKFLKTDTRHKNFRILLKHQTQSPVCAGWTMKHHEIIDTDRPEHRAVIAAHANLGPTNDPARIESLCHAVLELAHMHALGQKIA